MNRSEAIFRGIMGILNKKMIKTMCDGEIHQLPPDNTNTLIRFKYDFKKSKNEKSQKMSCLKYSNILIPNDKRLPTTVQGNFPLNKTAFKSTSKVHGHSIKFENQKRIHLCNFLRNVIPTIYAVVAAIYAKSTKYFIKFCKHNLRVSTGVKNRTILTEIKTP